jgi:hypothetical protein
MDKTASIEAIERIRTIVKLRVSEHHRERTGTTDLDVGYRTGLLAGLNIVLKCIEVVEYDR